MITLFVHGMGRSPYSGWAMTHLLKKSGINAETFSYMVSLESFATIKERLKSRLACIATQGEYVVIGHSLGGVLLRAALNELPQVKKPGRAFLLGSPIGSAAIARFLKHNPLYWFFTRDCGQLLASPERMAAIGAMPALTTAIIGNRGLILTRDLFNGQANDGIVSVQEAHAEWFEHVFHVPIPHSWLPQSKLVSEIVLEQTVSLMR